jgi:hypothetical protein
MPAESYAAQLLVEGKNDKHVILALLHKYQVASTFSIETPSDQNGGIEPLLSSIPVRLKIPRLQALGIVLDADQNLSDRWQAVKHRLTEAGYSSLPESPTTGGTIIEVTRLPKVGVWLMPDNQISGMLENFVAHLIPSNDKLAPLAESILKEIESQNLNRYRPQHRPKAFIHTWLAWQVIPGQPMGQAITAHVLNFEVPLARSFMNWLTQLFG